MTRQKLMFHRHIQLMAMLAAFAAASPAFAALTIYDYFSPRNKERPLRQRTDFIVLHTTEGSDPGSLNKIHANGEANYYVDCGGRVYKTIDRRKVAFHAGRSMWNGRADLDNFSIGIEVAGYHDGDITGSQYAALKELLDQLQAMYGIPDERVLTHSMVAYAAPNKWYKRSHRGRKRCGMLFAKRVTRTRLGLTARPIYDPDVKAGRLAVGDTYLASILYGSVGEQEVTARKMADVDVQNVISKNRSAWDVAGPKFNSAEILYVYPSGLERRGNEITKWKEIPAGTKVVFAENQRDNEPENVKDIGADGQSAREIAGDEYNDATTIYFLSDGRIRRGTELSELELVGLPPKTKVLVGYVCGGYVTANKMPSDVCGKRWNFPTTFYRFPDGSIKAGNKIDDLNVPRNTIIFYPN